MAVKALGLYEIIDKLDFEETKEENKKLVDTVNEFQDIKKEEIFLKQQIDFSSLSKTIINEINKICKKLEDPIIALIEFIDSYFELKNREKENKKN